MFNLLQELKLKDLLRFDKEVLHRAGHVVKGRLFDVSRRSIGDEWPGVGQETLGLRGRSRSGGTDTYGVAVPYHPRLNL